MVWPKVNALFLVFPTQPSQSWFRWLHLNVYNSLWNKKGISFQTYTDGSGLELPNFSQNGLKIATRLLLGGYWIHTFLTYLSIPVLKT